MELLDLAARLTRENPARIATHVVGLIGTDVAGRDRDRRGPSARTMQRHFSPLGLYIRLDGTPPETFGQFEAAQMNDRWVGDVAYGRRSAAVGHCCSRSWTTQRR